MPVMQFTLDRVSYWIYTVFKNTPFTELLILSHRVRIFPRVCENGEGKPVLKGQRIDALVQFVRVLCSKRDPLCSLAYTVTVSLSLSLLLLLENNGFFNFSQMQVILLAIQDEMQLFNCMEILKFILLFMLQALQYHGLQPFFSFPTWSFGIV